MTVELGHIALIIALCLACIQAVVPMVGSFSGYTHWMRVGHSMAVGQFVFVALSLLASRRPSSKMISLSPMWLTTQIHCYHCNLR